MATKVWKFKRKLLIGFINMLRVMQVQELKINDEHTGLIAATPPSIRLNSLTLPDGSLVSK
jgi:hypothetical protein